MEAMLFSSTMCTQITWVALSKTSYNNKNSTYELKNIDMPIWPILTTKASGMTYILTKYVIV
jgi:hypothetical protein